MPFVAPHGGGLGVVGGDGKLGPELVGETAHVGDAGVDVLSGVEGVDDTQVALRARHQLHQALGSGGRLGAGAVPGLDGDDGVHQVGVDAVPLGGRRRSTRCGSGGRNHDAAFSSWLAFLRELIELAERDADAELVDPLHDALDVASPAGRLEH